MTAAEINSTFFNPIADVLWLLLVSIIGALIAFYNGRKTCDNYNRLVIRRHDGSTYIVYAEKGDNGMVSLINAKTHTARIWPINRVVSWERLYFPSWIPVGLKIREIPVNDDDFEPILNYGAYLSNVASPDVIAKLREIAEKSNNADFTLLVNRLQKSPTRELIASPQVLGNLMMEKVTELLIVAQREILDKVANLMKKLDNVVTSTKLYVCTGLIIAGIGVLIYFTIQTNTAVQQNTMDINLIENALGIVKVTDNVTPPPAVK